MKAWILLFCLTTLAVAQPNFDYEHPTVKTVESNGDPSQKVDLVFVSDGYTARNMKDFDRDVRDACTNLFQFPLFREYKSYFNVHSAFVPAIGDTTKIHYPFGSEREDQRGMVILTRARQAHQVARKAPGCEVTIVLSTMLGRAHAGDAIVLPGRKFAPLAHELGHVLGDLGDEYSSSSSLNDRRSFPPGRDLEEANLTLAEYIDPTNAKTIEKTAKWKHFLKLPGAFPLVSAYQGGYYQAEGVWRPSFACIMNNEGAPFCPVCHEEMVKAIYRICRVPFDDAAYHRRHPLSQWR